MRERLAYARCAERLIESRELPLSDPQSEEALEHSWRCRVLRGVLRVVAYEDVADVLDVSGVF